RPQMLDLLIEIVAVLFEPRKIERVVRQQEATIAVFLTDVQGDRVLNALHHLIHERALFLRDARTDEIPVYRRAHCQDGCHHGKESQCKFARYSQVRDQHNNPRLSTTRIKPVSPLTAHKSARYPSSVDDNGRLTGR